MSDQQAQAGQDPIQAADARASAYLSERGTEDAPDYRALLHRYGEAMVRIGQLESRLDLLKSQNREAESSSLDAMQRSGRGTNDYAGLLQRYGEAMLRVGRFESGAGQSNGFTGGRGAAGEPTYLSDLIGRIEMMERDVGISPLSEGPKNAARGRNRSSGVAPEDGEVAQLRLQVLSLASQLARTEEQLKGGSQGRHRSRRSAHPPPKRQFWRT
jgi:hypothetical protein